MNFNEDINPREIWLNAYPDILPLYDANPLRDAFSKHEATAVKLKRIYRRISVLSVVLTVIGIVAGLGLALLNVSSRYPEYANLIAITAALFGLLGIVLQIVLSLTKLKEKWLLHRFASERLRSEVAMSFALGAEAPGEESLSERLNHYARSRLTQLELTLNSGSASFRNFTPQEVIDLPKPSPQADPDILRQCTDAFERFRVDYQKQFIEGQIEILKSRLRREISLTDILFFLGVLSAVGGLILHSASVNMTEILTFLGASLFVFSAAISVLSSGMGPKYDLSRYSNYLADINALGSKGRVTARMLVKRVAGMEICALRELDIFCQQVDNQSLSL